MLKETEETIVFFVTFLSLVAFQLGAWALLPGYAYASKPFHDAIDLTGSIFVFYSVQDQRKKKKEF